MIVNVHLSFTASIQCEKGAEHKKIENYLIEFTMGFLLFQVTSWEIHDMIKHGNL